MTDIKTCLEIVASARQSEKDSAQEPEHIFICEDSEHCPTLNHGRAVNLQTSFKTLADALEDLLPQTQCTQCGYAGCRPYAEAMARGDAQYNQCPPGGQAGIQRLAQCLGKPVIALNPAHGCERPRARALIDENLCIGCTLCIQACPVDAIVGAPKQMHTVIDALCTGCALCVAPCPVDCITMHGVSGDQTGWAAWSQSQADAARTRHDRRRARKTAPPPALVIDKAADARKRAIIQAAIERAHNAKKHAKKQWGNNGQDRK